MSRFRNISDTAAADLDEAVGWLLDTGNAPAAAERLLKAVLDAAELLAARPFLGRRRLDLLPEPFRFWPIPRQGLLLVYNPTIQPTAVLRVLHMSRDLAPLLADLRDPAASEEPG